MILALSVLLLALVGLACSSSDDGADATREAGTMRVLPVGLRDSAECARLGTDDANQDLTAGKTRTKSEVGFGDGAAQIACGQAYIAAYEAAVTAR